MLTLRTPVGSALTPTICFLDLYGPPDGVLKNNLSRDVTTRNCDFSRPYDLRTRSRRISRVQNGKKVFFRTVRLGARVPRAAIVTGNFKNNHRS